MLKFLHIVPDDKFWESAYNVFEQIGCVNTYASIVNDKTRRFRFLDEDLVIKKTSCEFRKILLNGEYDVIVFHYLSKSYYQYILDVPNGKFVVWISWGADIYYGEEFWQPIIKLDLFRRHTRIAMRQDCSPTVLVQIKKFLKITLRCRKRLATIIDNIKYQNAVLNRIDYISTVLPTEYKILIARNGISAKYFPFQYTSLRRHMDMRDINKSSQYILIGNSADWSNNHLDVLHLLQERKIHNTLYIPLAYGEETCKATVNQYLSANNIKAIVQNDLLSKEEYQSLIARCKCAVFGHIRQQAMGNIHMCLLQGSKVFLYKDSMAYKYLTSMGCIICSIEDDLFQDNVDKPLSKEEIEKNRDYILSNLSVEHVVERLKNEIQQIESRTQCNYQ